ncbi:hypothetical protein GCM10007276_02610 [Agaricicola taiwanensis]|uniref:DUF2628 domain-containing protein n=1 Tax=Agaricicola taiwanensis TaxID=591372 RepID=A0A8J2YEP5_9RHOB|nr:DUF2628 domain-containing protein [Agaricicola taiwanensis]GGE28935.1 hypothetical protein GCM10007276_02610 [Agaricicola taiwanensis]
MPMKLFTAHEPKLARTRDERSAEKIVFVKDGFAWLALFIPLLWLLWHRLWLGLLIYVLAVCAAVGLVYFGKLPPNIQNLLFVLPNVWLLLEGNDLRRRKLARRGLVQTAAVMGRSREEAEQRFFAAWVRASGSQSAPSGPAPAYSLPRGEEPNVLGVFPRPGGAS